MKINHYNKDIQYADSKEIFEKTNYLIFQKLSSISPIVEITSVKSKQDQFNGIDKLLKTREGKILKLEEKIRKKDWGDFLIEIIADNRYGKIDKKNRKISITKKKGLGWGFKDYSTDMILYFFEESNSGNLFSWKKFQKTFKENFLNWLELAEKNRNGFTLKKAWNFDQAKKEKFFSLNIAIPKNIFFEAYIKNGGKII